MRLCLSLALRFALLASLCGDGSSLESFEGQSLGAVVGGAHMYTELKEMFLSTFLLLSRFSRRLVERSDAIVDIASALILAFVAQPGWGRRFHALPCCVCMYVLRVPMQFGAQPWEMAGEIFAVGGLRVGMRGKKDKLSSCLPSSSSSLRASKAFRHEGGSADVFFSSSSAGGVSLLERDEGEESSGWLAGDGGGGLEGRTEGGEEGRLRSFGLLRIDACGT